MPHTCNVRGVVRQSIEPWPQDFTSAVMDVDYSPTGREFVAGSYDRSLRIFGHTGGHSREVGAARQMYVGLFTM